MSPDGSKIAATVSTTGSSITGSIYYCNVVPEPNTVSANGIVGSQGSAVELQYIGGSQFIPVRQHSGLLWANQIFRYLSGHARRSPLLQRGLANSRSSGLKPALRRKTTACLDEWASL